jgi:hypothetical protein
MPNIKLIYRAEKYIELVKDISGLILERKKIEYKCNNVRHIIRKIILFNYS